MLGSLGKYKQPSRANGSAASQLPQQKGKQVCALSILLLREYICHRHANLSEQVYD